MHLQGGQIEGRAGDVSYGLQRGKPSRWPAYGISQLSASSIQILSRRFFVLSFVRSFVTTSLFGHRPESRSGCPKG
jgi:hypothetical protein